MRSSPHITSSFLVLLHIEGLMKFSSNNCADSGWAEVFAILFWTLQVGSAEKAVFSYSIFRKSHTQQTITSVAAADLRRHTILIQKEQSTDGAERRGYRKIKMDRMSRWRWKETRKETEREAKTRCKRWKGRRSRAKMRDGEFLKKKREAQREISVSES